MTQSNINVRIDENVKNQFDKLCDELGLTMSMAINIFVKTVVREQRIPFELSLKTFNNTTLKAIEDTDNRVNLTGPFHNTQDLMKSLLEDE